jgi:hypothetical protein
MKRHTSLASPHLTPTLTCLPQLLVRHLDPARGAANAVRRLELPLSAAAGTAGLRVLLRAEPSTANAVRYYAVDPAASLGAAVAGKLLIEHPTLHVFTAAQVLPACKHPRAHAYARANAYARARSHTRAHFSMPVPAQTAAPGSAGLSPKLG